MADPKEPLPRMDIPFERLHQRMVNTCMEYEQAMLRKKVRVERCPVVPSPQLVQLVGHKNSGGLFNEKG
jgi:hypothetical protein